MNAADCKVGLQVAVNDSCKSVLVNAGAVGALEEHAQQLDCVYPGQTAWLVRMRSGGTVLLYSSEFEPTEVTP